MNIKCPLCNDTGEQRYWEGRWRDERAEIERLRTTLIKIRDEVGPRHGEPRSTELAATALEQFEGDGDDYADRTEWKARR